MVIFRQLKFGHQPTDVRRYIDNLADDVELAQTVSASMHVRDRVKLTAMPMADLADRLEPVIHEAAPLAVHRRAHSTASVVPDHHDVLDLSNSTLCVDARCALTICAICARTKRLSAT
jgi:hypothetical protein